MSRPEVSYSRPTVSLRDLRSDFEVLARLAAHRRRVVRNPSYTEIIQNAFSRIIYTSRVLIMGQTKLKIIKMMLYLTTVLNMG